MLILISIIIYWIGLLVFSLKHKHLLIILLILEFIILSLYLNIYLYLRDYLNEFYLLIVFLAITVCERVLGLRILVSIIRTHGNDYFQSFRMLW